MSKFIIVYTDKDASDVPGYEDGTVPDFIYGMGRDEGPFYSEHDADSIVNEMNDKYPQCKYRKVKLPD